MHTDGKSGTILSESDRFAGSWKISFRSGAIFPAGRFLSAPQLRLPGPDRAARPTDRGKPLLSVQSLLTLQRKSVQQYLQDLRLEEACRLLADTRRAVTDIAYSCGFPDSPSFCRLFRKVYGGTPLQFRQRMAKGRSGPAAGGNGSGGGRIRIRQGKTDMLRQAASLNAEPICGIHV